MAYQCYFIINCQGKRENKICHTLLCLGLKLHLTIIGIRYCWVMVQALLFHRSLTTVLLLAYAHRAGLLTHDMNRLFQFFRTSDFEMILRLVWQASNVNRSLQIPDNRTHQAYLNVRNCLIQAVRDIHPEYEQVSDKLPNMYQFLKGFDTVLSLNYDLLIYWTMTYGSDIQDGHLFKDCFLWNGIFDDVCGDFVILLESVLTPWFSTRMEAWPCVEMLWSRSSRSTTLEKACLEAILEEWRSEQAVPLFVSMKERCSRKYLLSRIATICPPCTGRY